KCRKPARLAGSRFWSRREWRDSFPASHRRKSGQRWSSRAWAKKFARFERRIHVHVKANCLGGGSGVRVLSVSLLLLGWHAPPESFSNQRSRNLSLPNFFHCGMLSPKCLPAIH